MKNDNRTSHDIERDIADERAQMSDNINDLQRKFSVDAIASDLGNMFRGQGGDIGRAIGDTLGRNPAAVVMVGVGLAWLVLGQDRTQSTNATMRQSGKSQDRGGNRTVSGRRPDAERSSDRAGDGPFRNDDRSWYGDGRMSGDDRPRDRGAKVWDNRSTGDEGAPNGVLGTVRSAASDLGGSASEAAGRMQQNASDLTDRLSHGLDDLSEEARTRIMSPRRAAHDARASSEALLNRGSRAATGFFEDQPLVVGALAVALGAAIGGALPHSRLEDDTLGDSSDQLFADAEALYREERDKAVAALRMAAKDTKGEIRDVGAELADLLPDGKSVGEVIADRTSDAASRVVNHAIGDAVHKGGDKQRT